jgi:hypothetical protein
MSLDTWPDARLVEQLVSRSAPDAEPAAALEVELRRRLADPARRDSIRRRLTAYATAAPEYVDEDAQAAARRYLAWT